MWWEKQAEALGQEIETLLAPLSGARGFDLIAKEALKQAGRGLAFDGRPWPLLPLIVGEAICHHYEHVLPAAAALQFLMSAGDVFDDLEDADSPDSLQAKYGRGTAINTATAFLILAQRAIARLSQRGVTDHNIVRTMDAISSFYTTACVGQQKDLTSSPESIISEDDYLNITAMKSASQIECSCHLGALLAGADAELIDAFSQYGHNLGMAAQITNDIQGINSGKDIINKKITLPVIFALTQTDNKIKEQFEDIFREPSKPAPEPRVIKDLLFNCGAVHYAVVKAEFYKQIALENLLQAEKSKVDITRLKNFLS